MSETKRVQPPQELLDSIPEDFADYYEMLMGMKKANDAVEVRKILSETPPETFQPSGNRAQRRAAEKRARKKR